MTANEFAEVVRSRSGRLRADDLVLNLGDRQIHGTGMLIVSADRIVVEMTLATGEQVPPSRSGAFTNSDCWKLTGTIEHHLDFRCDYTGPGGGRRSFNDRATLILGVHPLELIPAGWDAMSTEERRRERARLIKRSKGGVEPKIEEVETSATPAGSTRFHAVLMGYSVPFLACQATETIEKSPFFGERNSSSADTFLGQAGDFNFALIKETGGNLHVHLRSKEGFVSKDCDSDWNEFYALMNALAFLQGVHAWPYRIEYWRGGRKITDRLTAARELHGTIHTPFGLMDAPFSDALHKAMEFFRKEGDLSQDTQQILFLLREAGNTGDVTALAICALFESLVGLLFKELNLEPQALRDNQSLVVFEQAKQDALARTNGQVVPLVSELLKQAGETATAGDTAVGSNLLDGARKRLGAKLDGERLAEAEGYSRLYRAIQSAAVFTTREMFQAVVKHFGLKWDGDMEEILRTWKGARNPLAHRMGRGERSEAELKAAMIEESQIAGAINILVLKLTGYSGPAFLSVVEEKILQI